MHGERIFYIIQLYRMVPSMRLQGSPWLEELALHPIDTVHVLRVAAVRLVQVGRWKALFAIVVLCRLIEGYLRLQVRYMPRLRTATPITIKAQSPWSSTTM